MRFPLSQPDNLLVGLIEEHRDSVAVPNHSAYERQRRALRFGGGRRVHHWFNGWRNVSLAAFSRIGRPYGRVSGRADAGNRGERLPHPPRTDAAAAALALLRAGTVGPGAGWEAVLWARKSPGSPPYPLVALTGRLPVVARPRWAWARRYQAGGRRGLDPVTPGSNWRRWPR